MAIVIHTQGLKARMHEYSTDEIYWIYNGYDCCITREVFDQIHEDLDENSSKIYDFERSMQRPALEMMFRGIRVDLIQREVMIDELKSDADRLRGILDQFAIACHGMGLNPQSPKQLKHFFYDVLKIPPIKVNIKGEWKVSTNKEALEKLEDYIDARPFVRLIRAIRNLSISVSVLKSGVDKDLRMRFGYNVAGTETGRWSSNENAFGGGTNGQNIQGKLRRIFVPDKNHIMGYADLDRAEAVVVGYLADDENYIQACSDSDVHTSVARLCWPTYEWDPSRLHENEAVLLARERGHAPYPDYCKCDRCQAESNTIVEHHTMRDMSKRGGHATNYYATPPTVSKHLKIPRYAAEAFQSAYFAAFPGIREWQASVAATLLSEREITTPFFHRTRQFFGRPTDQATIREAIAYQPQSMVGDLLNLGLRRAHARLEPKGLRILGQVHDAVLYQTPVAKSDKLSTLLVSEMEIPIEMPSGKTMTIGASYTLGKNWMEASK